MSARDNTRDTRRFVESVEGCRHRLPSFRVKVAVAVAGDPDRGVPELFLHLVQRVPAGDQHGCAGVAEVVPAERVETCAVGRRSEVPTHEIAMADLLTLGRREHEPLR